MKTFEIGKSRCNGKRVLLIKGHDIQCWRVQFKVWRIDRRWKKKYPDYCRKCSGWGLGYYYAATRWEPEDWGPCESLDNFEICHRCGKHGLDEDGNGPCKHCNWEYDDGLSNYECDCYAKRIWEEAEDSIFY